MVSQSRIWGAINIVYYIFNICSLCERTTWFVCPFSLSNSSTAQSNLSWWTQKRGFIRPYDCSGQVLLHAVIMTAFVSNCRPDVLDAIVQLQHFQNQFLPNALRTFFKETAPLSVRNDILSDLITKFSERFCTCNPQLQLSQGKTILLWVFCLLLRCMSMMNFCKWLFSEFT